MSLRLTKSHVFAKTQHSRESAYWAQHRANGLKRKNDLGKPGKFTVTPTNVLLIMQTCEKKQIIVTTGFL